MQTVASVAREKLFNMRMSAEEWTRLEYLAKHYGLNAAGVLRMLVKGDVDRLHRETQALAPAPKPRKR
jgi:predicted DNA-binding protein